MLKVKEKQTDRQTYERDKPNKTMQSCSQLLDQRQKKNRQTDIQTQTQERKTNKQKSSAINKEDGEEGHDP